MIHIGFVVAAAATEGVDTEVEERRWDGEEVGVLEGTERAVAAEDSQTGPVDTEVEQLRRQVHRDRVLLAQLVPILRIYS